MKHIHCAFIKIGVAGDLMAVRMIYHQSTSKCASEQAHQRKQAGMVQHSRWRIHPVIQILCSMHLTPLRKHKVFRDLGRIKTSSSFPGSFLWVDPSNWSIDQNLSSIPYSLMQNNPKIGFIWTSLIYPQNLGSFLRSLLNHT